MESFSIRGMDKLKLNIVQKDVLVYQDKHMNFNLKQVNLEDWQMVYEQEELEQKDI